jgi:hypothetical protein
MMRRLISVLLLMEVGLVTLCIICSDSHYLFGLERLSSFELLLLLIVVGLITLCMICTDSHLSFFSYPIVWSLNALTFSELRSTMTFLGLLTVALHLMPVFLFTDSVVASFL